MEQLADFTAAQKKQCGTCGAMVAYVGTFVEFSCPSCGNGVISRCKKCKDLSNKYKCKNCGFTGP